MNKGAFITYISEKYNCTKVEAEKNIDMFTSSVIGAIGDGEEIALAGFGKFSVTAMSARAGRNPKTGEEVQIKAYNQPKFKVGQKFKDALNNR
jgi:nucleoid DNA-binding protein